MCVYTWMCACARMFMCGRHRSLGGAALGTEVTAADLQPLTRYRVRARAVNAVGAGPFSPTVVLCTEAVGARLGELRGVSVLRALLAGLCLLRCAEWWRAVLGAASDGRTCVQ